MTEYFRRAMRRWYVIVLSVVAAVALVFLHGAGGVTSEDPFLNALAEKYHVYEKVLRWDIPIPQAARDYARGVIPDDTKTLIISGTVRSDDGARLLTGCDVYLCRGQQPAGSHDR